MTNLSVHQMRVFNVFKAKNSDIPIEDIYCMVYGHAEANRAGVTVRDMQMKLAPTFKSINKKLKNGRIEVGALKQTYRYSTGD